MKAITDTSKLPKFLVCNNVPEKNWFGMIAFHYHGVAERL